MASADTTVDRSETMKLALIHLKKKNEALEAAVAALKEDNTQLEDKVATSSRNVASVQQQLIASTAEVAAAREYAERAKQKYRHLEEKVAKAKEAWEQERDSMSARLAFADDAKAQHEQLVQAKSELEAQAARQAAKLEELKKELRAVRASHRELELRAARLEADAEHAAQDAARATAERDSAADALRTQTEELQAEARRSTEAQARARQSSQELAQVKAEIAALKDKSVAHMERTTSSMALLQDTATAMLTQRAQDMLNQHQAAVQKAQDKADTLGARVRLLEDQLQRMRSRRISLLPPVVPPPVPMQLPVPQQPAQPDVHQRHADITQKTLELLLRANERLHETILASVEPNKHEYASLRSPRNDSRSRSVSPVRPASGTFARARTAGPPQRRRAFRDARRVMLRSQEAMRCHMERQAAARCEPAVASWVTAQLAAAHSDAPTLRRVQRRELHSGTLADDEYLCESPAAAVVASLEEEYQQLYVQYQELLLHLRHGTSVQGASEDDLLGQDGLTLLPLHEELQAIIEGLEIKASQICALRQAGLP